ncbi:hypothetical protein [Faecalitalea cylindroides]|uniref:hypothetical protein n=1 Tax=Faecalitalea cylindroides TaxID=39483 RepID=UPI000B3A1617|nr:hypothetical protein [Faecalitalea cylindroides]OUN59703.1 hypothetical protein B5G15_08055 [Faecalitalea cylindroides]
MENKLLITQALDERDLLVKKINSKIERIDFVDGKKRNEEKVIQQVVTKEEFCKKVKTSYQQIQDLIKRYQKIDEAIITSNANTYIETSFGTYSVAVALSMRNRLRELNAMDFETILRNKMEENYYEVLELKDLRNRRLEEDAEKMRLSILGKDGKYKDDKPLSVVDAYISENTIELIDPLNVLDEIESLKDKHTTLLSELETKIKISNATTFIEIH